MITPVHIALIAAVGFAFVLYQKGYLDALFGAVVSTRPRAKQTSDSLFEKAIVVALDEAKDKQTQALILTLKAKVEEAMSSPFAPAGATPPAPPAPAPATSTP